MRLAHCHNIADLRALAKSRLPWPVLDDIDGAADDETIRARKALAAGADCAASGRLYLDALAAAGQAGAEHAIALLHNEIARGLKLMGVTRPDRLTPDRLRWRR